MTKAVKNKFARPAEKPESSAFQKGFGAVIMFLYHARKLVMAVPVAI